MCLSSLAFFNIKYVVFGTYYNKHIISETHITKIKLIGGILEKECAALLSTFYMRNY
jgi:tRNA(Arg) A34 adenosine deaminase TadA